MSPHKDIKGFIEEYAKLIVSKPHRLYVKQNLEMDLCEVVIFADFVDVGKLIGKDGKMISSLKTIISGCKAKDGISYRVIVEPLPNE